MSERLFLDDAQYAVLRSLRDGREPTGLTLRARLLDQARETFGLSAERAAKALADLQREGLVCVDAEQRAFLAGGVVLHEAGGPGAAQSMRGDDGVTHLVLPAPTPADAPPGA